MSSQPGKRFSRKNVRRLSIETLEPRSLMAGDIDFDDGVLTITGGDYTDAAQIRFDDERVFVDLNATRMNGTIDHHDVTRQFSNVDRIVFHGLGGDDTVAVSREGTVTPDLSHLVIEFHGNGGEDTLLMPNGLPFNFTVEAYGGTEDDELWGAYGTDTLYGDEGNDYLNGQAQIDYLYGGDGEDELFGMAGDDWLYGGANNDDLYGFLGNDHLFGEAGDDRIYGEYDNDDLWGGADNDTLIGSSGNDTLHGEAGADTYSFHVDGGSDTVEETGNSSHDVISVQYASAKAVIDLSFGGQQGILPGTTVQLIQPDQLEDIIGTAYKDRLFGNANANTIEGRGDNDVLEGRGGNDTLNGGNGSDAYIFGNLAQGHDTIVEAENADADLLDFSGFGQGIVLNLGSTSGKILDLANLKISAGSGALENVYGTAYGDTLIGNARDNNLFGRGGNDTLLGGAGLDNLFGEAGTDFLYSDAVDQLFGGAGGDYFDGLYEFWSSVNPKPGFYRDWRAG